MACVCVRQTVWDGLTPGQQRWLAGAAEEVQLGVPAGYEDEAAVGWWVFDDPRITEELVATAAALLDNPALIPERDEEDSGE